MEEEVEEGGGVGWEAVVERTEEEREGVEEEVGETDG